MSRWNQLHEADEIEEPVEEPLQRGQSIELITRDYSPGNLIVYSGIEPIANYQFPSGSLAAQVIRACRENPEAYLGYWFVYQRTPNSAVPIFNGVRHFSHLFTEQENFYYG